jgi:type III restriction enzyme
MARSRGDARREIAHYAHADKERLNNPPVGLVTPDTDRDADKKIYAYDPQRSHINFCVYDSTWEAAEAFTLDQHPAVDAWVKNDHLGFEVLYVYRGVVRKYRPDFLIRLHSGMYLVLETKGRDTEQDRTKRRFLDEWVQAVNAHGGFGRWAWDVSSVHDDLADILARHVQAV